MSSLWHRQLYSLLCLRAALENGFHQPVRGSSSKDVKIAQQDTPVQSKTDGKSRGAEVKEVIKKGKQRPSKVTSTAAAANGVDPEKSKTAERSHAVASMVSSSNNSTDCVYILKQLCATGHVRIICWGLMHAREEIRFLASEVCAQSNLNSSWVINDYTNCRY